MELPTLPSAGIKNYGRVNSIEELQQLADSTHGKVIGFDIETGYLGADREKGSLHPETAIVVGISFTDSLDWARYAPLAHDGAENLDNREAAKIFWDLLSPGTGVAHNAGFELKHLARWFWQHLHDDPERGGAIRSSNGYFPVHSDTLVEAYLVAEHQGFGLKFLTKAMFDHSMTELHELFTDLPVNKRKFLRFNTLELTPQVIEYACEDAVWCLAIHQQYYQRASTMQVTDCPCHPGNTGGLLYRVEKAIVQDVLPPMEDFGVAYDWALMRRTADFLRIFRDQFNAEIMSDLSDLAGHPVAINLASPLQVRKILFETLGMRTTVYTTKTRDLEPSKRKMSTGDIALRKLAQDHSIIKKILQWRELTKLLGTYLDKYEAQYNYAADGRAHPNHLSAFVRTGRFAHSDPNYAQCLPGSYEVLTPQGWERLDKLADGVEVAQYTNDETVNFVKPSAVVRESYHGDMIEIKAGRAGRWRYTPDHRIIFRTRLPRGQRQLSSVKELTASQWERQIELRPVVEPFGKHFHDRYIPCAGYTAARVRLQDFMRENLMLAVAVQADGSRTNGHQYDITVYKDRKVEALRKLGLVPRLYDRGRWRVYVPVSAVELWLDESKNFRPEAILKLHRDDLAAFVDEIMFWDGDFVRGARYGQKTTRRQSVDVVQAAAALCGRATHLYEAPAADHVVVDLHPRAHRDSGFQTLQRVPSEGMVYCVNVPTGMFLVRNDEGHVQVTGNSPKKYHIDLAEAKAVHEAGEEPVPGTCFTFNFRDVITVPPEHYGLGFDLSQAELRAIAGEAQEEALLAAFARGDDVHKLTAALMLGIAFSEVTKDQRDIGKTMNFALLYGMSTKGLADRLGIPIEEAQALMDKYFAGLPGIAAYIEKQRAHGHEYGYVVSKFGRKLPIWEFESDKPWVRQGGDRACVNYPIQGAATGDYIKIAMVRATAAIKRAGFAEKIRLVMNIHDALEFYVHKSIEPEVAIAIIAPAVVFDVPGWPEMEADWHLFRRWGSPIDIDLNPDGTIQVKGEKTFELAPSVEVDDEGEEIVDLPDVDAEVIRAIVAPSDKDIRDVTLRLTKMPTAADWKVFTDRIRASAGEQHIRIITPEGDIDLPFTVDFSLENARQFILALDDPDLAVELRRRER